jgi:hypothetical protein
VATAVVAAALILPQPTEFGIKVAILSSLLLTCAMVPAFERLAARIQSRKAGVPQVPGPPPQPLLRRLATVVRNPVLVAVTIIAVGGVVNTALLALDDDIVLIERELTPRPVQ